MEQELPYDFPIRLKRLRTNLGLTQAAMAKLMGVSFTSVNRWENGKSEPSVLVWQRILRAEKLGAEALKPDYIEQIFSVDPPRELPESDSSEPLLDFSGHSQAVWALAETERLTYGHLFNPAFATETSQIDPLPHQRIAVYHHMLKQPRLRFMLADDAGAGKTIMTGLYIREMLCRKLIRRVLIIPPAGLVGNWAREMRSLFNLPFQIAVGADARSGNPFVGEESNLRIVSMDTLSAQRMFGRLQEPEVIPYDLVIFDEAHKLSATQESDLSIRRTRRYRLAEALSGISSSDQTWQLDWSCRHLLLLTATPHMGKDLPYYYLWRLLEPEILSTRDAFDAYPSDARTRHFIRRAKEEMVDYNGNPIYPSRTSDTLSFELTQGEISEQRLYDDTTTYIQTFYNRARILNRSAAQLAMSIFQRRLTSSTYALIRSFENRLKKLDGLIEELQTGRMDLEELTLQQSRIDNAARDLLDEITADEEESEVDQEGNEAAENQALSGVAAISLNELQVERTQVEALADLAQQIYEMGGESKFEKLREVLSDPRFKGEKWLIFTEHRDTLEFLVQRLEGLGYTDKVAQIHGGMNYEQRERQVEFFRREDGATYLVATDAAGEGINLQFCRLMINYDIPWNPARLEQRMGRIHRYKQKRDVFIVNLVAGDPESKTGTREGRVLKTLLDKLERIRKELNSDKVFDVIGRVFKKLSIKQYMEQALTEEGATIAQREIELLLTKRQFEREIQSREQELGGAVRRESSNVAPQLQSLKQELNHEELRLLLPGYVCRLLEKAMPLLGIEIEGSLEDYFSFKPRRSGALDPLWLTLETYPSENRDRFTVYKPGDKRATQQTEKSLPAIFLHPGEPVFERLCAYIRSEFAEEALKGGVFVDPNVLQPYLFHLVQVEVIRKAEPTLPGLAQEEQLDYQLIGLKQDASGRIKPCSVEHLLLLKGTKGITPAAESLVASVGESCELAKAFALERVARLLVEQKIEIMRSALSEKEDFLRRGYDYQEAELAAARAKQNEKARAGNARAKGELTRIKDRQRRLASIRDEAIATIHREVELVAPGEVKFLAHALVLPSSDPEEKKRFDQEVEEIAVKVAWAYEEAHGAVVTDVSRPDLATAAGLSEYPGFDLLSVHEEEGRERAIEVKGRREIGAIELTDNEWSKACNLRDRYWLYVVYECASAHPRLLRVQDPFGKLLMRSTTNWLIDADQVFNAAEEK
jgi:SNF2 family DNA or RNA helicase/DNA-binding XRE family transcriptional regulator